MSENKIDNNCLSFCQPSEVDLQKRDFLVKATAATGAVGVAASGGRGGGVSVVGLFEADQGGRDRAGEGRRDAARRDAASGYQ